MSEIHCRQCRYWILEGPSYTGTELGICYMERLKTTSADSSCDKAKEADDE